MHSPRKDSLINKSLIYLQETSKSLFDLSVDILLDPKKLTRGMGMYTDYNKNPIFYRKFHNLKRSSYFTKKNNNIYLTVNGRIKIIKNIIKEKNAPKKWNGKWIAMIFDIPEKNRRERNFLRSELKWIGFKELQKSIWIFPFDIKRELLTLLKLWHKDFTGDIRILIIDEIIKDTHLKKDFNL